MLTSRGTGLAAAAVPLAATGYGTGYHELYVLAAASAIMPLVALAWSARRYQLRVGRLVEPPRVRKGETALSELRIRNAGPARTPRLMVLDRRGADEVSLQLDRLPPGGGCELRTAIDTSRRGRVPLGPLRVRRADPFGLAASVTRYGDVASLIVHPATHPMDGLPPGVRASLDGSGALLAHGSTVFRGMREYVDGDDPRHIHWPTTARAGRPIVRTYSDHSLPTLRIVLDNRASAYPGGLFEEAVESAASIVAVAHRYGLAPVIQATAGASAGEAGHGSDPDLYLDWLAELGTEPADGAGWLRSVQLDRSATAVVIAGRLGSGDLDDLVALRRRVASLTLCALADPGPVTGIEVLAAPTAAGLAARWSATEVFA